ATVMGEFEVLRVTLWREMDAKGPPRTTVSCRRRGKDAEILSVCSWIPVPVTCFQMKHLLGIMERIGQLTIRWHLPMNCSHQRSKSESYERHFVKSQDLKSSGRNS